ncbi:DUF5305 domain-containing protein [Haloplanus ruber]|uniref:DUF5305 domain-containing protein n=1 Tax=Haloplanus ruber TaxID=869892 RepID=A0ABD6CZP3_9EURY|nr:DUF5305 domain-containing protein [Haloplanus ruber]
MAWGSDWPRGRIVLSEWFVVIAAVAAMLALVGGAVTYTAYASPGTTVEERQVSSWEGNGTYTTTARVTEPNPLYPVGTELSERPAYFLSVSPRMQGRFAFGYEATDDGSLDVTAESRLVMRSIAESDDGSPVEYWRMEESIDSTRVTGVPPGRSVELTFERNVSRTLDRMENVSDRLGGSPGSLQLRAVTRVRIAGEVNGQSVNRSAEYTLPIETDRSTYRPRSTQGSAVTGSTTERITRQQTYGPLWRLGGPAATILGLVAFVGLLYGRAAGRFAVTDAEREAVAFRTTREEFDDWITVARPPESVFDRPQVDVADLTGLVDTAIDTDERVFEHPDGTAYYVLHDDCCYVFEPPTASTDHAVPGDGPTEGEDPSPEAADGSQDAPDADS